MPIKTGNRKELVHWLIDLHNLVNQELNKKQMTYEEAIAHYESRYGCKIYLEEDEERKDINNNCVIGNISYNMSYLFIIILIVLLIFILRPKLN